MRDQTFLLRALKEKIEVLNGDRGDPLQYALRQSQISAVQEVTAGLLATAATINKNLALVKSDVDSYVTYGALISRAVQSSTITAPPALPGDGLMWAVPASATGSWAGRDGDIAIFLAGAWAFVTPDDGVPFQDLSSAISVTRSGTTWIEIPASSGSGASNYDTEWYFAGTPTSSQILHSRLIGRNVDLGVDFDGSVGKVTANPAATFLIDVTANGSSIGSISVDTAGTMSFTSSVGSVQTVDASSLIEFVAPAVVDATISDIWVTLVGETDGSTFGVPLSIINSGANTGDMTGWVTTGAFGATGASGWLVPYDGGFVFYGGASATSSATQTVLIDAASLAKIDSGAAKLNLSWQQNSYAGSDQGGIEITFLDSGGSPLGAAVGLGLLATAAQVWTARRHIGVSVPVGARSVTITMMANRVAGAVADAYFDGINGRIY